MRTHRLATIAAASTVALLALGGTAFALGGDDTPPTAATSTPTATAPPTTTATTTLPTTTLPTTVASSIGSARASVIAVNHIGGGQVTKIEHELEHGRVEWKVDVLRGNVRHEVRVDDATGGVVRAGSSAASSPATSGRATPRSDDGPLHDVGDDRGGRSGGVSGHGSDDGAAHDAGDDHGRGHDD